MRYVSGDDIRSLVRREGPLRAERAARIAAQIGSALDAAHAAGLVHRDIKPANVLLTAEDHVYLTDFGLTKHALSVAGSTKPGHWVGTLDYVAPEQIRGERIDARADVYALGCLLFFILTGEVPFRREGDEARLWAHLSEPPPKPSDARRPGRLRRRDRARAREGSRRALPVRRRSRPRGAGRGGRSPPAERERLVAKGAAAPVESPTVTAAAKPRRQTQLQPEPETVQVLAAIQRTSAAARCSAVALIAAAAAGVIAAVALGLGDDSPSPPQSAAETTGAARRGPVRAACARCRRSRVGRRPNVVRVVGDNVFVGSFTHDRVNLVSTETGKARSYVAADRRRRQRRRGRRFGSVWLAVVRATTSSSGWTPRPAVRSAARSRSRSRPARSRRLARRGLGRHRHGGARRTCWSSSTRRPGETLASVDYPYGIASIATSPSARLGRGPPPRPGPARRTRRPARSATRSASASGRADGHRVPRRRALGPRARTRTPSTRSITKTGDADPDQRRPAARASSRSATASRVRHELQLERPVRDRREALARRRAARCSLPVNPFALAVDGKNAVWVASQPEQQAERGRSQVPAGDHAGPQRLERERRALLVLGQRVDAEDLEQRPQRALDRVDRRPPARPRSAGWSPAWRRSSP